MNKKLLIISPYFPPANAADMQRVRTSLPYFDLFGWDTEVVAVNGAFTDITTDNLLLQSVSANIVIHQVDALDKKWTSKLGLGSIGLRSLPYYRKKVDQLLKSGGYDLIYFSTTQFPVCILGAYWKKKFGIPYVIDMQDPWHSEYYKDKPRSQRPPKYWFSYRLNKYLEPIALKNTDGLISVSAHYITDLRNRYPSIKDIPAATVTFGSFGPDLEIARKAAGSFKSLLSPDHINIVYVGRGGADMHKAIAPVFEALKHGLQTAPGTFSQLRFYFIGTSYAPAGKGRSTILPLAAQFGVKDQVVEITDRISYYHTLATLLQADALFVPGSDDAKYTASKLFPYLLTQKPLLAIFHPDSSVVNVINNCTRHAVMLTTDMPAITMAERLDRTLSNWAMGQFEPVISLPQLDAYSAKSLTKKQTELFDRVMELHRLTQ